MQLQNYKLISTSSELEKTCSKLMNEAVIAVDTEFFWEHTYYPILGLVQLATGTKECFLIDTVALADIRALGQVLENKSVVKILHDAPQDLGILSRETRSSPRNIFDTRTSAGFAGFESTISLQGLLKRSLDVELTKSETRSNWIKRPLTDAQFNYASDDVVHLPDLREYIIQACSDSTVRGWMEDENTLLENPEVYSERNPREMFRRVKGSSRLNARQLAILREVAEWRENKARNRNLPRNRVLGNSTLIGLALKAPDSIPEVKSVTDFPQKIPPGVIEELLNAIKRGMECPMEECPQPEDDYFDNRRKLKKQTNELIEYIQEESNKLKIDPALVASRADVETYIINQNVPAGKLGTGWRRKIVENWSEAGYVQQSLFEKL